MINENTAFYIFVVSFILYLISFYNLLEVKQTNSKKLRMWFVLSCITIVITAYTYYIIYFLPIIIKFKTLETFSKWFMSIVTIFMLYLNYKMYLDAYKGLPKGEDGNPL